MFVQQGEAFHLFAQAFEQLGQLVATRPRVGGSAGGSRGGRLRSITVGAEKLEIWALAIHDRRARILDPTLRTRQVFAERVELLEHGRDVRNIGFRHPIPLIGQAKLSSPCRVSGTSIRKVLVAFGDTLSRTRSVAFGGGAIRAALRASVLRRLDFLLTVVDLRADGASPKRDRGGIAQRFRNCGDMVIV